MNTGQKSSWIKFLPTRVGGKIGENFLLVKISSYTVLQNQHQLIQIPCNHAWLHLFHCIIFACLHYHQVCLPFQLPYLLDSSMTSTVQQHSKFTNPCTAKSFVINDYITTIIMQLLVLLWRTVSEWNCTCLHYSHTGSHSGKCGMHTY